jgi:hypothetical protein
MRCRFAFAVLVLCLPHSVYAETIGALDNLLLNYSNSTRAESVEAYIQLTQGSALYADGWGTYINLTGPDSKVRITGFGKTTVHTSLFDSAPGTVSDSTHVDVADFRLDGPIAVTNGAGLVKINLEIQGGAIGDYALSFDGANTYFSRDIMMSSDRTPFDRFSGGSIAILASEPSTILLSGILAIAFLTVRCLSPRRSQNAA